LPKGSSSENAKVRFFRFRCLARADEVIE
jgi:hypothetical protein